VALAREHGELIARAVNVFGFNTSLAPMVDLALRDSAEVLGTRCPAAKAAQVVEYARGFLRGMAAQGVVGCCKHFPGLGGGTRDSHLETPEIRRTWHELWQEDLEPYRALSAEMPMVMVNHAAYPQTADKKRPASVSNFWIQTVLRKRIGYRGIILSDDLEMGGVVKFMPIEEGGIETVRVGSELLLICHHAEPILRVYEALIAEGERSAAFRKVLLERARASERKRVKVFPARMPAALSTAQFEALRAKILRFGEAIEKIAPRGLQAAPKAPTIVETA
jgi:beta-N-acetylhexosaminidase